MSQHERPGVRALGDLMDLRGEGEDSFLAPTTTSWGPRLFGGLVAAQSLAAACRTVGPEHLPQSMHSYFILPGDPDQPLRLDVERTRDGRSFTTRRVVARQSGAAIFEMSASFHCDEEGADWSTPMPPLPGPDGLGPFLGPDGRPNVSHFDMRPVEPSGLPLGLIPYWVRTNEAVPDDPALRACVLTYLSDMGMLAQARPPGDEPIGSAASLDHSIWFHRPYQPDDWHLFTASSLSNRGGRGLVIGAIHHRDGALVATIAQEGLFRPRR